MPGSIERWRGCLLGLAAGDALGTTLEFKAPGTFKPHFEITGGGPFYLNPGEWTDDTSMALCLAESLIEQRGFDPADQVRRYLRWYREGHLASNGRCFDIGMTTRTALHRFESTGDPYSGSTGDYSAGNGSLMRLAPVPMAFAQSPADAVHYSGESSRTTHALQLCVDACRYYGGLLVSALNGASKEDILSPLHSPLPGCWAEQPLDPKVAEIAAGSFKSKQPPKIRGSGYVIHTLEAALWAFYTTETFEEGCIKVVNLGEDADTTGAVYGQLAGAYYGEEAIPLRWREIISLKDQIVEFAEGLYSLSNREGD